MPTQILEQLRLYNDWANENVLKTFEAYGRQLPSSSLRLLSHIFNAQHIWVYRLRGENPGMQIGEEHGLAACRILHEESSRLIREQIGEHAGDPYVEIDYSNSQGIPFRNSLFDILLQVFNHGTYHRAQIALDMRNNGLVPAHTDYITFVRLSGAIDTGQ